MATFIKAEPGMKHSVIYTDESGQYFRYSGGTFAWRNNNPGNIRPGEISRKHGQIGVCTSRLGHLYLKAAHCSFQVNLKNLIEKKPRR